MVFSPYPVRHFSGLCVLMYLSNTAQVYCNVVFIWVGFGTIVALLSHLLVPIGESSDSEIARHGSHRFRGFGTSLFCGIIGSCLGPLAVTLFWQPTHFNPISPAGLVISMIPAIILLVCLRWKSRA